MFSSFLSLAAPNLRKESDELKHDAMNGKSGRRGRRRRSSSRLTVALKRNDEKKKLVKQAGGTSLALAEGGQSRVRAITQLGKH
jgi:hypothetical protein